MTYTIIGVDGKQYGPIGEEDLRKWIAEGRVNGQSMGKRENEESFQPLSNFPEIAAALGAQAPHWGAPGVPSTVPPLATGDYSMDIFGCIGGGWNIVKKNFWPSVLVTLLYAVLTGVGNQLIALAMRLTMNDPMEEMVRSHHFTARGIFAFGSISILIAPIQLIMIAGLYKYFLKLSRGQAATIGDLFSGFGPSFGQLLLLGWVQAILVILGFLLCFFPGLYLSVAWSFAPILVIDREIGFWEALELSRMMVSKHWFVVFGFLIVYVIVVMVGLLACCVGILVTIPIAIAAIVCAYESIFSQRRIDG